MKLTELPPQCPSCRSPFNPLIKRDRELHPLAMILFGMGFIGSFCMLIVVAFTYYLILPASGVKIPATGPVSLIVSFLMFALVLAPGFYLTQWGLSLPRQVRMHCLKCGWKEVFSVDNHG